MSREAKAAGRQPGGGGRDWSAGHSQTHCNHTTARAWSQPRYGKVVGAVWRKTAHASRHLLKTPKAWCVDVDDLALVEGLGVRYVCIQELEQLRQYWARPETVRRKGFTFERGAGDQIALTLDWWAATPADADAVAEALREREPEAVGPTQMGLWR